MIIAAVIIKDGFKLTGKSHRAVAEKAEKLGLDFEKWYNDETRKGFIKDDGTILDRYGAFNEANRNGQICEEFNTSELSPLNSDMINFTPAQLVLAESFEIRPPIKTQGRSISQIVGGVR